MKGLLKAISNDWAKTKNHRDFGPFIIMTPIQLIFLFAILEFFNYLQVDFPIALIGAFIFVTIISAIVEYLFFGRFIIFREEEVPRKVISVIGDSKPPYREGKLIGNGRSRTLKSALSDLGWNLSASLHIEALPLGLSNQNYKVSCGDHGPLLLRIFGSNLGESNPDERHIQDSGFGANVVQGFEWGRLEAWLPGRAMQREDCDNSLVLAALANELRRLHAVTGRNHNDLNFTNVLICDSTEPPATHLLDFEYAGPLDPPFDIANFFCEWMYDCSSPRWFEPEPTQFPSEAQARSFIAQYLGVLDCAGAEVSAFLKEVRARIPYVHTFWINWAMKSFSDRDEYVQYAERRQLLFSCNHGMI